MRVLLVGGNNTAGPLPDLMRFLAQDARARETSFIGHPFAEDLVRRSQLLHRNGSQMVERAVPRERHRGALGRSCHAWLPIALPTVPWHAWP